jgi:type II secretory pathway component PulK
MNATQQIQGRQNRPWERSKDNERGSMLIVALGILALLSILAITFVRLMSLEHKASTNYVEGVRSRLIAEGGLERAMAQVTLDATAKPYSDITESWIYASGDYGLPLEEATAIRKNSTEESQSPRSQGQLDKRRASFTGVLGSSYDGGIDQYKIKVIDAQTQFNLNSDYEEASLNGEQYDLTYIRFLDTLGVALSKRPVSGTTSASGRNPILTARYPRGEPNAYRGGMAIYKFRQSRENGEFKTKTELLEVLESEDDFKLVRDYVTTKSWLDKKVVSPVAITSQRKKPWGDVTVREPRSPINVNLASKEILCANVAGIAGRGIYFYAGDWAAAARAARTQAIDAGTGFDYDPSGYNLLEEHEYEAKGVVVYFEPFGFKPGTAAADPPEVDGAYKFADLIWQRVQTSPFRSVAEWEDWIDRELVRVAPAGGNGPLKWQEPGGARRYYFPQHDASDLIITDLSGTPFSAQDKQKIRSDPRFEAWFYDSLRDVIKSNMNPCARLSGWNPDPVVRMNVDKGGLLFMDPRLPDTDPNKPLHQYQTNEWCFAPQGVFEIIALGEVLGLVPADQDKRLDEDDDGVDDREVYAQSKVRGILQLFETETHRTQRDFEGNGGPAAQGGYGDLSDRSELSSYPVPKIYWDPRAHGLTGQNLVDFYSLWQHSSAPGNMVPSDRSGYLQLATLKQEGTVATNDTIVVEMATINDSTPPHFEWLLQDRRVELPGQGRENTLDSLQADTSSKIRSNANPGPPNAFIAGRCLNRWGFPYLNNNPGSTNYGHVFGGGQFAMDGTNKWQSLVLTGDGYFNSALRPSSLGFRASDSGMRYGSKETFLAGPGNDLDLGGGIKRLAGLDPDHRGASNVDVNAAPAGGAGVQPDVGGNVSVIHKGGVSFWYKPDFDFAAHDTQGRYIPDPNSPGKSAQDPRFCGLLGVSHVVRNDQVRSDAAGTQGSWCRGTQMYITRTTSGDIRVTRLFYEVAGPPPDLNDPNQSSPPYAGVEEQPWVEDPVNGGFMPITVYWNQCQSVKEYTWPPKEFIDGYDLGGRGSNPWMKIAHARIDYFVPRDRVQHWRAGEWHHFAARWDDEAGTLKVFLDDEDVSPFLQSNPIGDPYQPVGGYDVTSTPPGAIMPPNTWALGELVPAFVRVNAHAFGDNPPSERDANPKDMITIGSIVRDQSQKAGIFKHTRGVGVGNNDLPANGTMDDVRFFDGVGGATNTISYDGHYEKDGGWRNELDLGAYFPPNTSELELGSIQMIAYLPRQYGARGNTGVDGEQDLATRPGGAGAVRMSFKVVDKDGADKHDFPGRWFCEFDSVNNPNAEVGFQLTDDQGVPVVVLRTDKLIYELEISSAKYQNGQGLTPGTGAGFPVSSPVVDQVSLTFILPTPKLLLKERVTH